jgi:arsenite methyltransferase
VSDWLAAWRAWLKGAAYSGFRRDRWQRPDDVIAALQIRRGARIAEIGSGGGYFTFRLADAAGPQGKVYAVDVDRDLVDAVAACASRRGAHNIETVLARGADPQLPAGAIDLVFTSNVYHHLSEPSDYFRRLRRCLAPGGRVAIIDSNGDGWFRKLFGHWTSGDVIESEMRAAGYRLEQVCSIVPEQHFLIFAAEACGR